MECDKSPIFIVGLPRSGSTLWLNLFYKHPTIYRIQGEMLFVTPFRRDFRFFLRRNGNKLTKGEKLKEVVDLIFSESIQPGLTGTFWTRELSDLRSNQELKEAIIKRLIASDRSPGAFFRILLEEVTKWRGYNRFCAKFPVHINGVPQLFEWYPNCKVVHVTRDPRSIAASRSNDPGGTRQRVKKYPRLGSLIRKLSMTFGVGQYIWASRLHARYRGTRNYALFSFEELLMDPEREIRRLCDFTEVEFSPEMLSPKEGQASSLTGETTSGFNKKAAEHWRKILSPSEAKLIWQLTKPSRERLARS